MPYIIQYDFLRIILKIFLDKTTTLYFGLTVPPKMITLTILNLHSEFAFPQVKAS